MLDPTGRRLNRRAFLAAGAAAAAGGAAALTFGCGDGSQSPTQTPNATADRTLTPRRGGEIVIGRLLNVLGLDPHIDLTGLDIVHLIYSYLYSWDPVTETAIFNNFASELEMPDPDGLEFIFGLRRGVKIHSHPDNPASGEELTSEDCRRTFVRRGTFITAPDKRFGLAISGTRSPDPTALAAALQTPDPYTFSFRMASRFEPALREMAKPEWAIVPAKVIEQYGTFQAGGLGRKAWGSGPFMLEEFDPIAGAVLLRHPEYFLNPRPWLDRIIFEVENNHEQLVSGLESGRYDALAVSIGREKYLDLGEDSRFTTSKAPTLYYPVIHFKIRPPFDDIRIREAIDLALDREKFIDAAWEGEANYNGPIAWPLEPWALPQDELRRLYPHDPSRARELLNEAGYADGFSTKMKFPRVDAMAFDIPQMAELIADDLSRVDIRVELDDVELGSLIANIVLPGNFETAFFLNLPYDDPDRPLRFYHTLGIGGRENWNNYSNPNVDRLVDAREAEPDEDRRLEIIHEAQRLMIAEHGPQITLPSGYQYTARWSYVHYPYEIGEPIPLDAGPWGADIWTEEV